MEELYLNWYNLAREALEYTINNPRSFAHAKKLVIVGMGGSAVAGDVVAATANEHGSIPVMVWKDFYVPKSLVDNDTAVLAISYSGNTRETILSLEQASKRTEMLGVIASGGKLIEIAKERGIPYIQVKKGLVPRVALPLLLFASLKLLSDCQLNLVERKSIEESISILNEVSSAKSDATYLASFLHRARLPLIIASTRYAVLAMRIKNELNENSKLPAKIEIAPELFHNDIVGWETSPFADRALIVESDLMYEREILDFYAEYLQERGFEVAKLEMRGRSLLARYLYGFLVAGLASVKIAKRRGIDPLATQSIAKYKELVHELEESIKRSVIES